MIDARVLCRINWDAGGEEIGKPNGSAESALPLHM